MSIFVTSDLHLNNNNVIKYCDRPFIDAADMNDKLIALWNETVKEDDTVYVLGDFIMGQADNLEELLQRLNGNKILIRGNHDSDAKLSRYKMAGVPVKDLDFFRYKGVEFILMHYPLVHDRFWEMITGNNKYTVLLYGHVHDQAEPGLINDTFHVGIDTNDYKPVNLDYIVKLKEEADRKKMLNLTDEAKKDGQ